MLKLLYSDIMRIREYLLNSNYDYFYQKINGHLNYFINPWSSIEDVKYNLSEYGEKVQKQFELLLLGYRLKLSECEILDPESIQAFLNVGFLKSDNKYIWSVGYSIISYFNRFFVVSILPDYKKNINTQEVYMGIDSYRLVTALPNNSINNHLDLCTGSGIQIIMEAPFIQGKSYGIDINEAAITVANFNSILNKVDHKTQFVTSNLYSYFKNERFDLITANPPFFPIPNSIEFPIQGNGGNDGLDIIRMIISGLDQHLTENGIAIISAEGLGNSVEPRVCDILRNNLSDDFKCEVFLQTRKPALFFIERISKLIINTLNYPKKSKEYKQMFSELFNKYNADSYYLFVIKISRSKCENKVQIIRNYSHWNDNIIPIIDQSVELRKGTFDCLLYVKGKIVGTVPNRIADCIIACNGSQSVEEIVANRCSTNEFISIYNMLCDVLTKLERIGVVDYK